MVATKHCAYGNCNSDSRYSDRLHMKNVSFFHFPSKLRSIDKCKRWVEACKRKHFSIDSVNKHTYICSKHFCGSNGPTKDFPDPIPATTSVERAQKLLKPRRKLQYKDEMQISEVSTSGNSTFQTTNDAQNVSKNPRQYGKSDVRHSRLHEDALLVQANMDDNHEDSFLVTQQHMSLDESLFIQDGLVPDKPLSNPFDMSNEDDCHFGLFKSPVKRDSDFGEIHFPSQLLMILEDGWLVGCKDKSSFQFVMEESCRHLKKVSVDRFTGLYEFEVDGMPVNTDVFDNLPDYFASSNDLLLFLRKFKEKQICEGVSKGKNKRSCTRLLRSTKAKRCPHCKKDQFSQRTDLGKIMTDPQMHEESSELKLKPSSKLKRKALVQKYKCLRMKRKLNDLKGQFAKQQRRDNESFTRLLEESLSISENKGVNLMLTEQFKAAQAKKKGMRWNPEIVKWAAYVRYKSASAYDVLTNSSFLSLPSASTLRRHLITFQHGPGFHFDVLTDMRAMANITTCPEYEKYVVLALDEMKIRSNIVYNKYTGRLEGFTNLSEYDPRSLLNLNELGEKKDDVPSVASHILALFVRGAASSFKYAFAHFPTDKLTERELNVIVWEGIEHLEGAGFRVVAIVCDGASTNRKFFKKNAESMTLNKCKNIYASDEPRPLWFIFDVPHLLKTTRNCLLNRQLMKDGRHMLWSHIRTAFHKSELTKYRVTWHLTRDHIFLTSYDKMNVRLAAQIFSRRTAAGLEEIVGDEASETVKFLRLMNDWFDMLNVSNTRRAVRQRNDNLLPYTSCDDTRLKWLQETFLGYLDQWKRETCDLDPSNLEKEKHKDMFLSWETYEGHRITIQSIVEVVPFLLGKGAKYILTSHFNQDVLEQEFSRQRGAGGRNENPTVEQYNHNTRRLNAARNYVTTTRNANTVET